MDPEQAAECPFCAAVDVECEHLMAVIDLTFMSVLGGHLYSLASHRLQELMADSEDDNEVFDAFVEELSNLASSEIYYEFEGGPGASTNNLNLYSSDPAKMTSAYLELTT